MITSKWFSGNDDLADAYFIRRSVFIEEQKIDEDIEYDGTDGDAEHLVLYEKNQPVATGRLIMVDDKMHIGRMAVLKKHRGNGLGERTMTECVSRAVAQGHSKIFLHAQAYARGFYEKLGFVVFGNEFEEAGIPHVFMKKHL